jgi:hypothetical protein
MVALAFAHRTNAIVFALSMSTVTPQAMPL